MASEIGYGSDGVVACIVAELACFQVRQQTDWMKSPNVHPTVVFRLQGLYLPCWILLLAHGLLAALPLHTLRAGEGEKATF